MTLRHLDLFSGIGGFALAVRWLGHETVGFCEIDPWCRKVLDKHWPEVPKHDDIRTLNGNQFGPIDIITGGFPCQPFSVAGERRGEDDPRHLWPAMLRVIDEARPRFVLGENVAGIINMALDGVLADLEAIGYTARAVVIPAGAVNALHRRDRVWIMAHRNGSDAPDGGQRPDITGEGGERRDNGGGGDSDAWQVTDGSAGEDTGATVADTSITGLEGYGRQPEYRKVGKEEIKYGGASDEPTIPNADKNRGQPIWRGEGVQQELIEPDGNRASTITTVPDTECSGQPRPGECGHASDPAQDREGQAGDAEYAGAANVGRKIARALDTGADGLSPGLVRRSWADGTWEIDLPRVVTHEAERKQKLMAAGNAIVPVLAYEILKVMIGEVNA